MYVSWPNLPAWKTGNSRTWQTEVFLLHKCAEIERSRGHETEQMLSVKLNHLQFESQTNVGVCRVSRWVHLNLFGFSGISNRVEKPANVSGKKKLLIWFWFKSTVSGHFACKLTFLFILTLHWGWHSFWLHWGWAGNPGRRPVEAGHLCSSALCPPTLGWRDAAP